MRGGKALGVNNENVKSPNASPNGVLLRILLRAGGIKFFASLLHKGNKAQVRKLPRRCLRLNTPFGESGINGGFSSAATFGLSKCSCGTKGFGIWAIASTQSSVHALKQACPMIITQMAGSCFWQR